MRAAGSSTILVDDLVALGWRPATKDCPRAIL